MTVRRVLSWAVALAGAVGLVVLSAPAASAGANNISLRVPDDNGNIQSVAYFDGDANGEPGKERIKIGNRSLPDGMAAVAWVRNRNNHDQIWWCRDWSDNGKAEVCTHNMFKEEKPVEMRVCHSWYEPDTGGVCTKWFPGRA